MADSSVEDGSALHGIRPARPQLRPLSNRPNTGDEMAGNGDRARQQLERIRAMVRESRSNCTIEVEPASAVDSVYLRFHCGAQMHRVQWVGVWLESLSPDDLWRELDIATRGAIKKTT